MPRNAPECGRPAAAAYALQTRGDGHLPQAAPPAPGITSQAGKALAAEFDSLAATMRLAQMTAAPVDVTRMTSVIKAPAAPVEEPPPFAPPPAQARPAVAEAPEEPEAQEAQPFPVAPAAVLGLLVLVALGLGIALAL